VTLPCIIIDLDSDDVFPAQPSQVRGLFHWARGYTHFFVPHLSFTLTHTREKPREPEGGKSIRRLVACHDDCAGFIRKLPTTTFGSSVGNSAT
jgi:hypothetical protein